MTGTPTQYLQVYVLHVYHVHVHVHLDTTLLYFLNHTPRLYTIYVYMYVISFCNAVNIRGRLQYAKTWHACNIKYSTCCTCIIHYGSIYM